jgi:hypothetical protein
MVPSSFAIGCRPAGSITEPADSERDVIVDVGSLVVGPPMTERRRHPPDYLEAVLPRSVHHESGDPAHAG